MTKKKTPTPVKKALPKKKADKSSEYKWTQTGETKIPGIDAIARTYDVEVPAEEANAMFKSLVKENHRLTELLSKHQSEPMQQLSKPLERTTMLSQFAEAFDGQLSRLYNSLNTLDSLANRLVLQKQDGVQEKSPEPHDLSTRLSNLLAYFSQQNDRLDLLNAKLSDLI